ncbi:MAG: COQ9 family protein [Alphaproteobacteria bacterium]
MDKTKAADEIINAALPLVVYDGWSMLTLHQAAMQAGYKKTDVIRVFPGGAMDAVEWYLHRCDTRMSEALADYSMDTMKLRQRIALAVRTHIELHNGCKEAARRTAAFLSLPLYATTGLGLLYRTVDSMWYAVGDTSTDISFYTKRMSLGAIYSSTFLHYLDDESAGHENSWAFLERRIDDIMAFGKIKRGLQDWLKARQGFA